MHHNVRKLNKKSFLVHKKYSLRNVQTSVKLQSLMELVSGTSLSRLLFVLQLNSRKRKRRKRLCLRHQEKPLTMLNEFKKCRSLLKQMVSLLPSLRQTQLGIQKLQSVNRHVKKGHSLRLMRRSINARGQCATSTGK